MLHRLANGISVWWRTAGMAYGIVGELVFDVLILLFFLAVFSVGGNIDAGRW